MREEPADLVPYMLDAFLSSDAEFRKALREKTGKEEASSAADQIRREPSSLIAEEPRSDGDKEVRELRKPPRLVGQRSDGPSD